MTKEPRKKTKKQTKKSGNPYLDKVLNGKYLKLPNEMIETVYRQYFRPNESKVFWFIVRKTWGWEKYSEFIELKEFNAELHLSKIKLCETLSALKDRQIITQLGNKTYAIQMNIKRWKDNPKKNKNITQLGNKNQQTKIHTKIETIETKKPTDKNITQLGNGITQLGNKALSENNTQSHDNKGSQRLAQKLRTKETLKYKEKVLHQDMDMKKTKPDDDSLLSLLKPKTLTTLKNPPFGLGEPKIICHIAMTKKKQVNRHFSDCIEYILSRSDIGTPGRYFMTMIEEGDEAPPPLYLTKRVELFNDFTGKQVRPEKTTAFENRIEKQVLEKAKERIKEIDSYCNLRSQIERAKDAEIKLRWQKREQEERQKAKAKLIRHICSIIKTPRLKMFRRKLLKLDPGNKKFKDAITRGYKLHTEKPYIDSFNEKVA